MNLTDRPTPETDQAEEALGIWSVRLYSPAKKQLLDHARSLEQRLSEALEKLSFLKEKGLTVGLLKDGHGERLAYVIEPDSELCDLKHVHKVIDTQIVLDKAEASNVALRKVTDKLTNALRMRDPGPEYIDEGKHKGSICCEICWADVRAVREALAEYSKLNPETK